MKWLNKLMCERGMYTLADGAYYTPFNDTQSNEVKARRLEIELIQVIERYKASNNICSHGLDIGYILVDVDSDSVSVDVRLKDSNAQGEQ